MYDTPATGQIAGAQIDERARHDWGGPVNAKPPGLLGDRNGRSEIAEQMENTDKGLAVLHQSIDPLEQRLAPVLFGGVSERSPTVAGAPACSTQVATYLAQHNQRLSGAIDRLRTLADRIGL